MSQIPFYSEQILNFFTELKRVLEYNEPVTVFGPDTSRLSWLIESLNVFPQLKSLKLPPIKILDLSIMSDLELQRLITYVPHMPQNHVVAFLGIDQQLLKGEFGFVKRLLDVLKNEKLQYMFFVTKNIFHPSINQFITSIKADLTANILYFTLSEPAESKQFINYLECKYEIKIDSKTKMRIINETGGYFWLLKQCVRLIRDHVSLNDNLFLHDEIRLKVAHIFQQFSDSEKEILRKLPTKISQLEEYYYDINHLSRLRWISQKRNMIVHRIPLLEKYIQSLVPQKNLTFSRSGDLLLNDVVINKLFSTQERKLLKLFILNINCIVPREQVAQILWGNNWEQKYSDWAIDQQVSRLRKKLQNISSTNTVKVKKGKGFVYQH